MDSKAEMGTAVSDAAHDVEVDQRIVSRSALRILAMLCIMLAFSFLDRINIGFAGPALAEGLHLSGTQFGMASGVFYFTYVLAAVPSNLVLARVGVRKWMAFLMCAWGVLSTCTMFAHDFRSLCAIRAAVGLAEGGFLPGMLFYMTRWFPVSMRARASAIFLVTTPVTSVMGAFMSGLLLRLDGVGQLAGWQWVFFVEGFPAVLLGVAIWFYLPETPTQAWWLSMSERRRFSEILSRDELRSSAVQSSSGTAGGLSLGAVLTLAIFYFFLVNSLNLVSMWVPTILKAGEAGYSNSTTSLLLAIPHLFTVIAMIAWGVHSDRRQERRWHLFTALLLAMVGWITVAFGAGVVLGLMGVALASAGANAGAAIFWTLPDRVMPIQRRALGLAVVNAVGNAGSIVSPVVVGVLRDLTHSYTSGILYAVVLLAMGALMVPFVAARRQGNADRLVPTSP